MSAQRARSAIAAEHRSVHPDIPGVPWWGAVAIAVGATAVGFAFDAGSGNKELSSVFAALYFIGCVLAVLAVRQQAIFTAVVQPPLILFVAVPGAYFLFHYADIHGLKDILINCGYPLIERFLLMFTTSVIVLLLGMGRWYLRSAARPSKGARSKSAAKVAAGAGLLGGLKAKLSALGTPADPEDDEDSRKHAIDRTARPASAQGRRATKRPAPTRSRHARPPIDDPVDDGLPPAARPRRRPTHAMDPDDPAPRPRQRQRPTPPRDRDRRVPPPEYRRSPRGSREPGDRYERPARRPNPYEQDPLRSPATPYPDTPPPPPRRRPVENTTHNPFSQVRYRGQAEEDDEGRVEYRRRPPRRYDDWRTDA